MYGSPTKFASQVYELEFTEGKFRPPPAYFQSERERQLKSRVFALGAGSALTYSLYKGYKSKTNTAKILFTAGGIVPLFFAGSIYKGLSPSSLNKPIFNVPVIGGILAGAFLIAGIALPELINTKE